MMDIDDISEKTGVREQKKRHMESEKERKERERERERERDRAKRSVMTSAR